jgi:hypothetical protein
MRESAGANECRARQGDRVGDPKAAKTDREGSLLPSVSFQEGSTEDACNPGAKSIIKTIKCFKDVGWGASAKEVDDFAEP